MPGAPSAGACGPCSPGCSGPAGRLWLPHFPPSLRGPRQASAPSPLPGSLCHPRPSSSGAYQPPKPSGSPRPLGHRLPRCCASVLSRGVGIPTACLHDADRFWQDRLSLEATWRWRIRCLLGRAQRLSPLTGTSASKHGGPRSLPDTPFGAPGGQGQVGTYSRLAFPAAPSRTAPQPEMTTGAAWREVSGLKDTARQGPKDRRWCLPSSGMSHRGQPRASVDGCFR